MIWHNMDEEIHQLVNICVIDETKEITYSKPTNFVDLKIPLNETQVFNLVIISTLCFYTRHNEENNQSMPQLSISSFAAQQTPHLSLGLTEACLFKSLQCFL